MENYRVIRKTGVYTFNVHGKVVEAPQREASEIYQSENIIKKSSNYDSEGGKISDGKCREGWQALIG
jgi:hypothetical protein